jgi:hypothetical protein
MPAACAATTAGEGEGDADDGCGRHHDPERHEENPKHPDTERRKRSVTENFGCATPPLGTA